MPEKPVINWGLEGVYVNESSICKVDGQNGKLWYRGYKIEAVSYTHLTLPTIYSV